MQKHRVDLLFSVTGPCPGTASPVSVRLMGMAFPNKCLTFGNSIPNASCEREISSRRRRMSQSAGQAGRAVPEITDAQARAERERRAIIRAAHRLLGHSASGMTPIEDILRAAGVNRRTF